MAAAVSKLEDDFAIRLWGGHGGPPLHVFVKASFVKARFLKAKPLFMKAKPQNIESIDTHRSRRIRAVRAEDIALEVNQHLGDFTLTAIYQKKIRPQRTRQYELHASSKKASVEVLHTLLGIELKVGNRRLLCPDLSTARYLAVFARLGCDTIAIPYDITQISCIADELESSWHRMMLLIEHLTEGRSPRLRNIVRRKLIEDTRASITSLGAGSKFPEFNQPARRRPTR